MTTETDVDLSEPEGVGFQRPFEIGSQPNKKNKAGASAPARSETKTSKVDGCEGPIDRIALLQIVHGPECNVEHIDFPKRDMWSEEPLPTQLPPNDLENFTGKPHGRGIIVGFYGKVPRISNPKNLRKKGKYRNYWVIQCWCGGYQLMNHKTIRRGESHVQKWMCYRCCHVRNIKRGFGTYHSDLVKSRLA